MSRQREERRAHWQRVLERQRTSGMNIRQFCREEHVSEASFHSWKRKLALGDRPAQESSEKGGQKQSQARPVTKQGDNAGAFIPLHVVPAASECLEIVHPRGHVVRVPAVFDESSLRQVLGVLDHQTDV